jgi:glycosyltransferase involved in cell wall biosynthesis
LFNDYRRSPKTSEAVHYLWRILNRELMEFVNRFRLDLLIVENALSLPMNVPLGMALTELIAETSIPTIAHHHDFVWERPRYTVHAAGDYLQAAFPPMMPNIHNVVISSYAATELARRTGMRSTTIPNVMDFAQPPQPLDDYAAELRTALGIGSDEVVLLQPTRIVPRKRIERSLELASRLDSPCAVVVTHSSGDEGREYQEYLQDLAERINVRLIPAADHFNHQRALNPDGDRIFSLADAYQQSDLVTYPSSVEGFGNAFLEAIYYACPLVMSNYEIFRTDIKPKGFEVIEFADFLTRKTLDAVRSILEDPSRATRMTEQNYELGRRYYSYDTLRKRLQFMLDRLLGRL